MTSTHPEKKKHGLSRLLGGGKRDRSPGEPAALPDSAYASSEHRSENRSEHTQGRPDTHHGDSMMDRTNSDIQPAEKNSEIANIDKDKNLGLKPSTGEVFDQDTGQVVTVVTTTTTTTTTTTQKPRGHGHGHGHGHGEEHVERDVRTQSQVHDSSAPVSPQQRQVGAPASPPQQQIGGPAEMPANTSMIHQGRPTATQGHVSDRDSSTPMTQATAPSIPHKSLARKSGEYGTSAQAGPVQDNLSNEPPVSPSSNHNFSYPARNRNSGEPEGNTMRYNESPQQHTGSNMRYNENPQQHTGSNLNYASRPQQSSGTTFSDLKAAAKGLHGVGETLRGTLNSSIDQNFQRKNANKNTAAQAKNQAVLDRGRNEMGGIPTHYGRPGRTGTGQSGMTANDHSTMTPNEEIRRTTNDPRTTGSDYPKPAGADYPSTGTSGFSNTGTTGQNTGNTGFSNTGNTAPNTGTTGFSNAGTTGHQSTGTGYSSTGNTGPNAGTTGFSNTGTTGPNTSTTDYSNSGTTGPNSGTTSYLNSGTTGPNSGTTSYLNSGNTGPNTGNTGLGAVGHRNTGTTDHSATGINENSRTGINDNSRTGTNEQPVPGQWTDNGPEDRGRHNYLNSPEDNEARKSRSIGKLFKRKPVGNEGGQLRTETSKSRERKSKYY